MILPYDLQKTFFVWIAQNRQKKNGGRNLTEKLNASGGRSRKFYNAEEERGRYCARPSPVIKQPKGFNLKYGGRGFYGGTEWGGGIRV